MPHREGTVGTCKGLTAWHRSPASDKGCCGDCGRDIKGVNKVLLKLETLTEIRGASQMGGKSDGVLKQAWDFCWQGRERILGA